MPKKSSSPNKIWPIVLGAVVVLILIAGAAVSKKVAERLWQGDDDGAKEVVAKYQLPQPRSYDKPIELPKPKLSSGMSLEAAIQNRRSRREFSEQPVALAEVAQVLWSAQGVTDPKTGHRAAPSARESYPFTVFVVVRNVTGLQPGLYEYLPQTHSLGMLKVSDAGEQLKAAGVQPGAQQAPVVFVLSAAYGKAEKILGASVVSSSLLEAGHIGQNMYLQTESLKMGMVVMAGFDAKKVGTALSLDPAETVVYLMPFGHPAPEKEVLGATTTSDATHQFTTEELSQYDGKNGNKAYFAFEGKVYDATGNKEWKNGEHYTVQAGKDLTGTLGEAPHGAEVLSKLPVVGTYGTAPAAVTAVPAAAATTMPWYYAGAGVVAVAVIGVAVMMVTRKKGKK